MKTAFALILVALGATVPSASTPLTLPDGEGGIGFDDLLFSPRLHQVLVPSGRTGRLNLVDPKTHSLVSISGFSVSPAKAEGHGAGTTSADSGGGFIFATDRNRGVVNIVDPAKKQLVATTKLGGGPDYVRWVEPLGEVWVTEPRRKVIEVFHLETSSPPKLVATATIKLPDGPESLVVDLARGRAYTHSWHDTTFAIELKSHSVVARWSNGCEGARGSALDEKRGFLFVGCEEGKAITLDVAHDGKQLGSVKAGKGVDIVAYSPSLSHLYVPGGDDATLTVVGVGDHGQLTALGSVPTAPDAHCVAADDAGNAYVCDPQHGQLLVFNDSFPATR
jgi:hypothetical protein